MPDQPSKTVTGAGVADILGISRQLAYRDHITHPDFPDPCETTPLGRRWNRVDVEAYKARRRAEATT